MIRRGTKRPRFSVGGHPVYENDDSSNHSGLGIADFDENSLSQQHETSTNSSDQQHFPQNQYVPDRSRRAQAQSSTKLFNDENDYLNACLDHLFTVLSQKDREGFFQYPVTDQLAPGYSQVVAHPMDFSTIRKKIHQDEYSNILEFRADFELMCENAMKYNRPETIYWQAAKKLSQTGTKLLSKEKLVSLRRTVECFTYLTEREFGFRLDLSTQSNDEQTLNGVVSMDTSNLPQRTGKVALRLPRYYEKLPNLLADEEDDEEFSPEEILSQAQQVAQCSREKLSLRRPISAYSLSHQRTNGTTTLPFLNQTDSGQTQTRVISIGELSNLPSSAGAPSASAYHPNSTPFVNEIEKRNRLLPRYFLDYGPFSTHAPQYDSSFCSIAKDELDLLIHTYGSEFATQNGITTIDYVKDSGDIALAHVDRLFSSLKKVESFKQTQNNSTIINGHVEKDSEINDSHVTNGLTTLDSIGKELLNHTQDNLRQQLDVKLDENAKLLFQLRQVQYDRLSQPSHKLHQLTTNSQQQQSTSEIFNENELAEKVLRNLNDMSQMTIITPGQIISPAVIHHNLGVVVNLESLPLTELDSL